jgi:tRNA G26 N,N-dimethylase Trm1
MGSRLTPSKAVRTQLQAIKKEAAKHGVVVGPLESHGRAGHFHVEVTYLGRRRRITIAGTPRSSGDADNSVRAKVSRFVREARRS